MQIPAKNITINSKNVEVALELSADWHYIGLHFVSPIWLYEILQWHSDFNLTYNTLISMTTLLDGFDEWDSDFRFTGICQKS